MLLRQGNTVDRSGPRQDSICSLFWVPGRTGPKLFHPKVATVTFEKYPLTELQRRSLTLEILPWQGFELVTGGLCVRQMTWKTRVVNIREKKHYNTKIQQYFFDTSAI